MNQPLQRKFIYNLSQDTLPNSLGSKANNLRKLLDMGIKIPRTYCCSWEAYDLFKEHRESALHQLQKEISETIDLKKSYAIRSSTDLEDRQDYTYAGQFITSLDIRGLDSVLQAIQEVWESSQVESMLSYQSQTGDQKTTPKMAVILQEMVPSYLSGVVFSKNPITGLKETIIEAVEGPGTALVQEGITPLRWVYKWEQYLEQPAEKAAYTKLVQNIVAQTEQIVQAYGQDIDLEWVYDGEEIYWVQLREITAIEHIHIYSNKISKEFLPGMIKPLVWSVNVPLVNGAWVDLLTEVIGENDIKPESLARSFYYRAYFDTNTFGEIFDQLGMPRQALEINMGIVDPPEDRPAFRPNAKMIKLTPRLLSFLYDKWKFSIKIDSNFSVIESQFQDFAQIPTNSLNQVELLEKIDQLYSVAQEAAYYNIVVPLLMYTYNGAVRRQLKKYNLDIEKFDLTKDLPSLEAYAPDASLERLSKEFRMLNPDIQATIRTGNYESFQEMSGIEVFQKHVRQFIDQFGHLSDSGNDFSVRPWREDPDLILSLITSYHAREDSNVQKVGFEELPAQGPRRWFTRIFYQRARKFLYYRERISSAYTFGYGLFRKYYLAIGDCFVRAGEMSDREDIFYLFDEEIRQAAAGNTRRDEIKEKITQRKSEMQDYQDIDLPELIYGEQLPPLLSPSTEKMHGTPTSRGIFTGSVRVVRGLHDFDKVSDGDVIVIPYSDVGWTPLFSKAGAIIAESGGMLSHSSIIAREYNIPAVVSVANACTIADNTTVTVDGYHGDIFIHEKMAD